MYTSPLSHNNLNFDHSGLPVLILLLFRRSYSSILALFGLSLFDLSFFGHFYLFIFVVVVFPVPLR